jgi:hypothetical protein
LSARMIQKVAHAALLDGCQHAEVATLASCGNFGDQQGNIHRDVMNQFLPQVHINEPCIIKTKCRDNKTSQVQEVEAATLMPHELLHALSRYEAVSSFFDSTRLVEFWSEVERSGCPKLKGHPLHSIPGWKQKCIPIFIHGDGVEFQTRDSLMVYSWGPLLAEGSSQDTSFLVAAFPKSSTTKEDRGKGTWDPLLKEVARSFEACFEGLWPSGPLAGQPLAGGFRLVLWCLIGDHDYFSNTLGLAHWRNDYLCWCCNAQQHNWRVAGPERQWTVKSVEECLGNRPSHPLFNTPGTSTLMVSHDLLHVLFCKGILSHLMGGALHYWIWPSRRPRPRGSPASSELGRIFARVQELYKQHKSTTRLTNLRLSMFTTEDKHWQSEPFLKVKGSEARHLLPCLTEISKERNTGLEHEERLQAAFEAIDSFVRLLDRAGNHLSPSEALLGQELVVSFVEHSQWLEQWALGEGRLEFHMVPKYHMLVHLAESARYLNPKLQWCFKSEDFVGKVAKLGHSISMGVASQRISLKLVAKYRIWLHLRFTRDNCFVDLQG